MGQSTAPDRAVHCDVHHSPKCVQISLTRICGRSEDVSKASPEQPPFRHAGKLRMELQAGRRRVAGESGIIPLGACFRLYSTRSSLCHLRGSKPARRNGKGGTNNPGGKASRFGASLHWSKLHDAHKQELSKRMKLLCRSACSTWTMLHHLRSMRCDLLRNTGPCHFRPTIISV